MTTKIKTQLPQKYDGISEMLQLHLFIVMQ